SFRLGRRWSPCHDVEIADLEDILIDGVIHAQTDPSDRFQVEPAVGVGSVGRAGYQVTELNPANVPLAIRGNDGIGRKVADILIAFPEEDPDRGWSRTPSPQNQATGFLEADLRRNLEEGIGPAIPAALLFDPEPPGRLAR